MSSAIITIGNFGGASRSVAARPSASVPPVTLHAATLPAATPAAGSSSHLRLTARGRAVLVALVAIPVVAIALFVGLNAGGATATSQSTPLTTITVTPGETLWQVAEKIAPGADPRDVIADIMQVNQLDTASIAAGEQLRVPAQYASH